MTRPQRLQKKLKNELERLSISQVELAERTGINPKTLNTYINGKSMATSADSLEKLAHYFGQTLQELNCELDGISPNQERSKPLPKRAEEVLFFTKLLPKHEKTRLIQMLVSEL
jgi:transcriptional regulator with XRE-family HTH domain